MGFFDKINYSMIVNAFKTAVYKGKGQTFISLAINVSATTMRNIHWLCLNYLTIVLTSRCSFVIGYRSSTAITSNTPCKSNTYTK